MRSIYVKDSVLKQFPPMSRGCIDPLFIENGIMPDRKGGGKTKNCFIYINFAGVYFLRPVKLSKSYKISLFISTYVISEFIYIDSKRRTLVTRNREVFFECLHSDEAVQYVIASRKILYQGIPEQNTIKLTAFPQTLQQMSLLIPRSHTFIRYVAFCERYMEPPSDSFIKLLTNVDAVHHPTVTLDNTCVAPINLRCLFIPIIQMGKIKSVRLYNFAPYSACRLAHFLLKHSPTIDTIIFEGYSVLVPEQLRMDHIPPKKLLSFIFKDCKLREKTYESLIEQLSEYGGEIQRLTFNGVSIPVDSWNVVFNTIFTSRPWKTLEIVELDGIDSKMITNDQVSNTVLRLLKHCRFIQKLSLSNWAQPILLSLDVLTNSSILTELVLNRQDMTEPFPENFRLPFSVHYVDFGKSNFTFLSIQSLFKVLSEHPAKNFLSLVLSDITLPEAHWRSLFAAFPTLPQLKCLKGLDWSGNMIEDSSIDTFVHYFFDENKIVSLTLDRVFGSQRIEDLKTLLLSIGKNKLWFLSIGGNIERNFSGYAKQLLDAIEYVSPINILRLNGQNLTDSDTSAIADYVRYHPNLLEISVDGTSISNENRFFDFYNDIFSTKVMMVGRPNNDISRIFGPGLTNLTNGQRYKEFKTAIQDKLEPLHDFGLGFYATQFEQSERFDVTRFLSLIQRYPKVYTSIDHTDPFLLGETPKKPRLPSLTALKVRTPCRTLSDLHATLLIEPTKIPRYRPPAEKVLPAGFDDGDTNSVNFGNRSSMIMNFGKTKIALEPLAETIEMQQVLAILTDNGEEEEQNEGNGSQLPVPDQASAPENGGYNKFAANSSFFAPDNTVTYNNNNSKTNNNNNNSFFLPENNGSNNNTFNPNQKFTGGMNYMPDHQFDNQMFLPEINNSIAPDYNNGNNANNGGQNFQFDPNMQFEFDQSIQFDPNLVSIDPQFAGAFVGPDIDEYSEEINTETNSSINEIQPSDNKAHIPVPQVANDEPINASMLNANNMSADIIDIPIGAGPLVPDGEVEVELQPIQIVRPDPQSIAAASAAANSFTSHATLTPAPLNFSHISNRPPNAAPMGGAIPLPQSRVMIPQPNSRPVMMPPKAVSSPNNAANYSTSNTTLPRTNSTNTTRSNNLTTPSRTSSIPPSNATANTNVNNNVNTGNNAFAQKVAPPQIQPKTTAAPILPQAAPPFPGMQKPVQKTFQQQQQQQQAQQMTRPQSQINIPRQNVIEPQQQTQPTRNVPKVLQRYAQSQLYEQAQIQAMQQKPKPPGDQPAAYAYKPPK